MTRSPTHLNARLSLMMFLEFAGKGVWFVVMAGHLDQLGFSGRQISYVYATGALGALAAPLVVGWLADRWLPAQHFAAVCHLLAGAALVIAWRQEHFLPFWGAVLAYALLTSPTVALANAISFTHTRDPQQFGHIRVWGTMGWMSMNWLVGLYLWLWEKHSASAAHLGDPLLAGAVVAWCTGLYCLTLPSTPPTPKAPASPYAFLAAIGLLRHRNLFLLLASTVLGGMALPFFYNLSFLYLTDPQAAALPDSQATWVISLGQFTELGFMLLLGRALVRLGMKWTLIVGLLALAARALIFSVGHPLGLVVAAQTLHGLDVSFFFIAMFIAAERLHGMEVRASVQALMLVSTYGLGMLIGHLVSGRVYDALIVAPPAHRWDLLFLWPAALALLAAALLVLFFDRREYEARTAASMTARHRAANSASYG